MIKKLTLIGVFFLASLGTYALIDSQMPFAETTFKHDWECNYIITECYSRCGKTTVHYVDRIQKDVSGSITFVGEDGLLTTIPYPYYTIEENPKPIQ